MFFRRWMVDRDNEFRRTRRLGAFRRAWLRALLEESDLADLLQEDDLDYGPEEEVQPVRVFGGRQPRRTAAAEGEVEREVETELPAERGGKFELYRGKDNQFYFRLRAANGESLLASEGYTSRAGAENGIMSVRENARLEERYRRRSTDNDEHYFLLQAANNRIIGASEMYSSPQSRDRGIQAVMRAVEMATVTDQTTKTTTATPALAPKEGTIAGEDRLQEMLFAIFDEIEGDEEEFLDDGRPRVKSVNERIHIARDTIDEAFAAWQRERGT